MRNAVATLALVSFLSTTAGAVAEGFRLAPFKDDLFGYQRIVGESSGGDFVMVEYLESRDVGARDEVELKKVHAKYVSLEVNETKKDLALGEGPTAIRYVGVGKTEGGAKIVVIFLHGAHGDRTLAMEDFRFGGNFNRLKNLMAQNDGVYVSPDFVNFTEKGKNEVKALIQHYSENSPGAPIIVGCASTGCKIVFRLLADPQAAKMIGGVVLLGSLPLGSRNEGTFFDIDVIKGGAKPIPILVAHGSKDPTVHWVTQELFFKNVKKAAPDYPIKFHLFMTANHGIPIRMIDWRLVLNWMLEVNGK